MYFFAQKDENKQKEVEDGQYLKRGSWQLNLTSLGLKANFWGQIGDQPKKD